MKEPQVIRGERLAGRSASVRKRIDLLKESMASNRWELAELLSELLENNYHYDAGFQNFDDFIDQSNMDIGAREARYHIRIHRQALELGISRDQLKRVAISKLKEIFVPDIQPTDIVRLVKQAETATLDQIRDEVKRLKGAAGVPTFSHRNLLLVEEDALQLDEAVEVMKLEAGTAEDADGNSNEISYSRAVALMSVEFMQDPNRAAAKMLHELGPEEDFIELEEEEHGI